MRSVNITSLAVIGVLSCAEAAAESDISGDYACTVHEKAGVASIHLEGADPPRAYGRQDVQTTFGMRIAHSANGDHPFTVMETEDRGEAPDRTQYHTDFSVLHSAYYGDGFDFTATEDQAFLRLHHKRDGGVSFYHAGFEYPGGVDVNLSVRFGECEPKD
ncbi:MAG: hypothetical protein AAFX54_02915 [Pseudomonadota bacterium]